MSTIPVRCSFSCPDAPTTTKININYQSFKQGITWQGSHVSGETYHPEHAGACFAGMVQVGRHFVGRATASVNRELPALNSIKTASHLGWLQYGFGSQDLLGSDSSYWCLKENSSLSCACRKMLLYAWDGIMWWQNDDIHLKKKKKKHFLVHRSGEIIYLKQQ